LKILFSQTGLKLQKKKKLYEFKRISALSKLKLLFDSLKFNLRSI